MRPVGWIEITAAMAAISCASEPAPDTGWKRDWAADPAVAASSATELYAVSDLHGAYERAVELLTNAGLAHVEPSGVATWLGGKAVLVVVGDVIDKGDRSIDTLDLLRQLEADAPNAGGQVIVTLGNHEAEFLANIENDKAAPLRDEIERLGLTATGFASTDSRWGLFLHRRPLAALVSGWFFAHAGDTGGHTAAQLAEGFQKSVDANDWSADAIIGSHSPLESQDWWSDHALTTDLAALGARHVVMGHDPNAFSQQGEIGAHFAGRLVRIDCGMTPTVDHSKGRLLHVSNAGKAGESVSVINHTGKADALDMTVP